MVSLRKVKGDKALPGKRRKKNQPEPWVLGGDYAEVCLLAREAANISMPDDAAGVLGKGLRSGGGW